MSTQRQIAKISHSSFGDDDILSFADFDMRKHVLKKPVIDGLFLEADLNRLVNVELLINNVVMVTLDNIRATKNELIFVKNQQQLWRSAWKMDITIRVHYSGSGANHAKISILYGTSGYGTETSEVLFENNERPCKLILKEGQPPQIIPINQEYTPTELPRLVVKHQSYTSCSYVLPRGHYKINKFFPLGLTRDIKYLIMANEMIVHRGTIRLGVEYFSPFIGDDQALSMADSHTSFCDMVLVLMLEKNELTPVITFSKISIEPSEMEEILYHTSEGKVIFKNGSGRLV